MDRLFVVLCVAHLILLHMLDLQRNCFILFGKCLVYDSGHTEFLLLKPYLFANESSLLVLKK